MNEVSNEHLALKKHMSSLFKEVICNSFPTWILEVLNEKDGLGCFLEKFTCKLNLIHIPEDSRLLEAHLQVL